MPKWLRKVKTDEVFSWNEVLEKEDNMVEVSTKEKDECLARFAKMQKETAAANMAAALARKRGEEPETVEPDNVDVKLEDMKKPELVALAKSKGLDFPKTARKADIIELLTA